MLDLIGRRRNQIVLRKINIGEPKKEAAESDMSSKPTTYQIRKEISRLRQLQKEQNERAKFHLDILCSKIASVEYGDNFELTYQAWKETLSRESLETMRFILDSIDSVMQYSKYYGQYDYNMELDIPKYECKKNPGKDENDDEDKLITDYSDDVTTNYMEWQMRFVKNFKKAGVPFETMCYRVWSCVAAQNNEGIPPRLLLRSDYAGSGITGFRIDLNMLNELFADADLSE